jgi:hypothetical protein
MKQLGGEGVKNFFLKKKTVKIEWKIDKIYIKGNRVKCQPPLVVISHESVHSRSIKWCFDLLILPLIIFFSYPMISWVNNKVKCQIQFPSSIFIPLCNHVLEFPDTHNYTSQAKYTSYWSPWANWIKLSQLK